MQVNVIYSVGSTSFHRKLCTLARAWLCFAKSRNPISPHDTSHQVRWRIHPLPWQRDRSNREWVFQSHDWMARCLLPTSCCHTSNLDRGLVSAYSNTSQSTLLGTVTMLPWETVAECAMLLPLDSGYSEECDF